MSAVSTGGAITNIGVVTVQVSNQDKALDFYVGKLHFEKRFDETFGEGFRWLTVAPPGAQTQIVLAHGYGTGSTVSGGFTGMVFETDDIHATYRDLSARGVQFTETPTMQPWGMLQAQFVDDDGNHFVLVQRPHA